ncbi:MAG: phosphatase PAP2 family protein [Microthrixaceae bacterium]
MPRPQPLSAAPGAGPVRHPDDLVVALLAAGVLAGTTRAAGRDVGPGERRVFEVVNRYPSWLEYLTWLPMQLGSLWGPFAVGAVAWWRLRSWRAAVGAVACGVLAWQLAKAVKAVVERGRPLDELDDVVRRLGTPREGLGFVSGHAAVSAAIATTMSPYLSRPGRAGMMLAAAAVGTARIHVAAHLPLDVVGGAALGVVVGEVWRFAVGIDPAAGAVEQDEGAVDA